MTKEKRCPRCGLTKGREAWIYVRPDYLNEWLKRTLNLGGTILAIRRVKDWRIE